MDRLDFAPALESGRKVRRRSSPAPSADPRKRGSFAKHRIAIINRDRN